MMHNFLFCHQFDKKIPQNNKKHGDKSTSCHFEGGAFSECPSKSTATLSVLLRSLRPIKGLKMTIKHKKNGMINPLLDCASNNRVTPRFRQKTSEGLPIK